jgi:hypothetical protein
MRFDREPAELVDGLGGGQIKQLVALRDVFDDRMLAPGEAVEVFVAGGVLSDGLEEGAGLTFGEGGANVVGEGGAEVAFDEFALGAFVGGSQEPVVPVAHGFERGIAERGEMSGG